MSICPQLSGQDTSTQTFPLLLLAGVRRGTTLNLSDHNNDVRPCRNVGQHFGASCIIIMGRFSPSESEIQFICTAEPSGYTVQWYLCSCTYTDWKASKHGRASGKLSYISLSNRLMCFTVLRRYPVFATRPLGKQLLEILQQKHLSLSVVEIHSLKKYLKK